jgi:hypothetical protein
LKITILIEGRTEMAFKPHLLEFLRARIEGPQPKLRFQECEGRIHKEGKLRRTVENLLQEGNDAVIALTDVYTGTSDFQDAEDAKAKMKQWVGAEERFHPHAAQHDFEAWLLPYWADIQKLAGHKKKAPAGVPEAVNHGKPPSYHIKEIFEIGKCRDSYSKPRDTLRILKGKDLAVAAAQCPELKAFLNTILRLSGADEL